MINKLRCTLLLAFGMTLSVWSQLPPVPSDPIPTNDATAVSAHALLTWNNASLPGESADPVVCYTLGGDDEAWVGPNRLRANVVSVPIAQTLAQISMELSFTGPLDVHYYVFEATSKSGAYTPVFHKVVSQTGAGRSLYSSGPMKFTLQPGRYYAIGAAWGGSTVTYYRQRTTLPTPWALGTLEGYLSADMAPPFAAPVSGVYEIGVYSMELCFPSYDVYLGTTPGALSLVASNLTGTAGDPGPLSFDTTYYWQVVALNTVGASTGAVWRFTTASDEVHFMSAAQSVNEGDGAALITVVRENPSAGTVTVHYAATNGTATAADDFTPVAGTLEFPAGVTSTNFVVPILDDDVSEDSETIQLTLSQPSQNVALGAPSSGVLTIMDNDGPPDFQIGGLFASNSRVVDHNAVTGDDRGGIAISPSQVFVTGDSSTARFNASDLSGGFALGMVMDALCTDLQTETVYSLGDGSLPLTSAGGTATTMIELDGTTGLPTGVVVPLSSSITMPGFFGNGIFSGYGRVLVYNGSRVYDIWLPSGRVTDLGDMITPNWEYSENWAIWGVAEAFDGALYLAYREGGSQRIVRSRVPDGQVSEVATFSNLSDMASFVVSPLRGRWYFHYEGSGQFGGSAETLGYADALLLFNSTNPPVITRQPANRTVAVGDTGNFCILAFGGDSVSYQWERDGMPILGATQSCYSLPDCQLTDSGSRFSCLVSNDYGGIPSSEATLTVLELGAFFDNFDPDIHIIQWSSFGGVVGTTVLATNYGGFVSSPNSLWFGASGDRYAVSRSLDTSLGGEVDFWLRIANGSSSTWENADLPGEGIVLEYSIDDGSSWVEFGRYDTSTYTTWTHVTEEIPPAAQAPATLLRWRQLGNSGSGYDHWALDDVGASIGPRPPQIRTQPSARTVLAGGTARFDVEAYGSQPLSFHWLKDNTELTDGDRISGALTNHLVIVDVQTNDAGLYSVVVTNDYGSIPSSSVLLTVELPPPPVEPVDPIPTNNATGVSVHTLLSWSGAGSRPGSGTDIQVLVFAGHADTSFGGELSNTVAAVRQFCTNAVITITTSESPADVESELADKDVFLLPEQELWDAAAMATWGTSLAGVLNDFVNRGGRVIACDYTPLNGSAGFLSSANLMHATVSQITGDWPARVAVAHPITDGVSTNFTIMNGSVRYGTISDGLVLVTDSVGDQPMAACREIGDGGVVLLGCDFYLYNDDMAQLLCNAIRWKQGTTFDRYQLFMGANPGSLELVASNLNRASFDPGMLAFDTTYYWQVMASNPVGSVTGAVWRFTTALDEVHFAAASSSFAEQDGFATISVRRENPDAGGISVHYASADGTATAGSDYTAVSGTLEFPADVMSLNFRVPVRDDSLVEGMETVLLGLSQASSNVFLATPTNSVLKILDDEGPPDFRIADLSDSNSQVVDHDLLTGDDRGGIAISPSQVFITGDSSTARFNAADLTGGTRLGVVRDSLCCDLRTEKVYTLADLGTPLTSLGGTVTMLLEVNGNTGSLGRNHVNLSQSINMPGGFGNGIFSGYGRIVVFNGSRVYDIFLPSGQVTDRGAMFMPNWELSENWAVWGVAEAFDGALYLTYREGGSQRIVRSRVPDGAVTGVAAFSDLSDMASFVVSPSRNRWYFHYEFSGQFGGTSETLGYADAQFASDLPPIADAGPDQTNECAGVETSLLLDGSGSTNSSGAPLTYEWSVGGVVLGTNMVESVSLPVGVHEVILTVRTPNGVLDTDTTLVTVVDSSPPTITCPAPVVVEFTDENGAAVAYTVTATDECSDVDLQVTPPSGTLFPIGTNTVESLATDASGNQSSCSFEVIVLGARGVMESVRADLQDLQADCDSPAAAALLNQGIAQLDRALDPNLWIDETHLVWNDGDNVFHGSKNAVRAMERLVQRGNSCATESEVADLINRLVKTDRLLAVISLHDAESAGVRANQLAEEYKQLEKGDRFRDQGWPEQAIESYRHAWKQSAHMTIKTFARLSDGSLRIELQAAGGAEYTVEASTNLVNWEVIGTVQTDRRGQASLVDPKARDLKMRYYRIVRP